MKKASDKKPFLVPPWKIGLLVALLLIVVGIGVGYYFVSVYNVNLEWLNLASGQWRIDSYMFFREMYPLVASVVVLSLFSYFVIASAVRRYKFYLDSGQDYRKMVALAGSIDDLTDPAQISKLSSYPELQSVLRNYGDSIREVSVELDKREAELTSGELESELESLFDGGAVPEKEMEQKWWGPIVKMVADRLGSTRSSIEGYRKENETARRVLSQAVLSHGKVIELISRSGEDLLEIVRAVGELNSIAKGIETGSSGAQDGSSVPGSGILTAVVTEMENTLKKLDDGSRVLGEFSNENNGLALNMALMAAKGNARDQDLAQFAEKIRSTAESFNKLSGTISSISQGLLGNCYKLKEKMGGGATGSMGNSNVGKSILDIASRIEERSKMLQQVICNLGSEFHDVHEALQGGLAELNSPEAEASADGESGGKAEPVEDAAIVNFGSRIESGESKEELVDSSDIVIEHAKLWAGDDSSYGGAGKSVETREDVEEGISIEGLESSLPESMVFDDSGGLVEPGANGEDHMKKPARGEVAREEEGRKAGEKADSEEGWMEMPGHKWIKIDVGKDSGEEDKESVEVEIEDSENKEEPVYDLFELGAVEYIEETKVPEMR